MPVLSELLESEQKRKDLSVNIAQLAIEDSDIKIAEEILKLVGEKRKKV